MVNIFRGQIFYTDCSHYFNFLNYFGTHHTFQTFCDKGRDRSLIKQFHGTIKEHFQSLTELNRKGAGIFFTVNETDLKGRTSDNIKRVRSVFIDLDGGSLPDKFELQPHLITNTSPGKYHCYWIVEDIPLVSFSLFQEALANKFKSDPKVKDLPRVMRVAGFYHNKNKPYPIKIHQSLEKQKPYTRQEIRDTLGLQRPKKKIYEAPVTYQGKYNGAYKYGASEGDRHEQLVRILVAIKKRGESYDYAKKEALEFARSCVPPENPREVIFQLNDIWKRY